MVVTGGEADDLIFDGGAIARPGALYLAGIHGGAVEIAFYYLVGCRVRSGNVTINLRDEYLVGQIGKRLGWVIAGLAFQTRPVDGFSVEPWGRSGLEPAHHEVKFLECVG